LPNNPAFGEADLTNCERELIHLAGSVQPHGLLLTLGQQELVILQISANSQVMLGVAPDALVGKPVSKLGGNVAERVAAIAVTGDLAEPTPLICQLPIAGKMANFEGTVHRNAGNFLLVEIEPIDLAANERDTVDIDSKELLEHLSESVNRFSDASTIGTLCDAVVGRFRDMTGYDRVMVYKFDPEGHGNIIAEARDPRLESLLGHRYPTTDIPQRARELYVRNKLRTLEDVNSQQAPLVPRQVLGTGEDLDMSMCHLRSMSPLHIQYLKNMGVTATLVVSLIREGRLWGLIACHHYAPRNLRFSVRAAAGLLAEVISTRIAAIENYAHAQVAIQVRRLEQRLVEATSTEGDWALALFRNPHTLLQPLDASGAALFYDGEIHISGEVPSTPELRALLQWVHGQQGEGFFQCSSISKANPALQSLTVTASGVLAVRLSASRANYLMWFRKEQLHNVVWAGNPAKTLVRNNPLELSPRRSFAAWSEMVRGTALTWSASEIALARAFGTSLTDIILQVNAVRLLIAEHQLEQARATTDSSLEAVVIGDARQQVIFANDAFFRMAHRSRQDTIKLGEIANLFEEPAQVGNLLSTLACERRSWQGSQGLKTGEDGLLPVTVRAEVVPARDGSVLGFFLIFEDMTKGQRAAAARQRFEQSLHQAGLARHSKGHNEGTDEGTDELIGAVLANASLAAMDIIDGNATQEVEALLEEIDNSTQRATALYGRLRIFNGNP
jgi:two-component system, chemotaxis family, sensor kinase Cph1